MQRRVVHTLVGLLIAVALSGCVQNTTEDDGSDETPIEVTALWAEDAVSAPNDHDHDDPTHHTNRTTPNFKVLSHDSLITDYHGETSGGYWCGDVSGTETADGRRIAVVHSYDTDVAFVVMDVTDPDAIEMIGELVMPNTFTYDVAISPDGLYASIAASDAEAGQSDDNGPFLGAMHTVQTQHRLDLLAANEPGVSVPTFRSACDGTERPLEVSQHARAAMGPLEDTVSGPGVILIDMADPANPVYADLFPTPVLGAHSTTVTQVDGTTFVVGAITNLEHHSSYFEVLTVLETPLGPKLQHESTIRPAPPTDGSEQPTINGHVDGEVSKHPITGDVLAWLADWDGGLVIYDMNNPKAPTEVGRWSNYQGHDPTQEIVGDSDGSIHTAFPMDVVLDDKHYTVIGQEVLNRPKTTPTGNIFIMDTTDPANPTPVLGWTLPVDPVWDNDILWSTHYADIQVRDDGSLILYVAMYHGGLWAVNITGMETVDTIGVFVPAVLSEKPSSIDHRFNWAPLVMEALILDSERVLTYDGATGAYVLHFDPSIEVPDVEEWEANITG